MFCRRFLCFPPSFATVAAAPIGFGLHELQSRHRSESDKRYAMPGWLALIIYGVLTSLPECIAWSRDLRWDSASVWPQDGAMRRSEQSEEGRKTSLAPCNAL